MCIVAKGNTRTFANDSDRTFPITPHARLGMGSQTNLTCATKKFARACWKTWSPRTTVIVRTYSGFHLQACVCVWLQPQRGASCRIRSVLGQLDQLLIPSGAQNMPPRSPGALQISPEDLLKPSKDPPGEACDPKTIPTLKTLPYYYKTTKRKPIFVQVTHLAATSGECLFRS